MEGAEIKINKDGSMFLNTPLGIIQEGAPLVFQNGKQLKATWLNKNNVLSFEIENYHPNYELVIDPVTRIWGTYYGGTSDDIGYSSATDFNANVYMCGSTGSNGVIATTGAHQTSLSGSNFYDAFIAKFNSSGARLWGTYYGGTKIDEGYSCSTDQNGNVYMAGYTASDTSVVMTTSLSHQPAFGGGPKDAFLVKFNLNGVRQWGTYYGGAGDDQAFGCVTDPIGNVYLSGSSSSSVSISTIGSHQPAYAGNNDAFLIKFNTNGARQWGTYYGGGFTDGGNNCAADINGNIYLTGYTSLSTGTQIATGSSHQSSIGGGFSDAFLVKFNGNGIRQWGTYYGGANQDGGRFCAVDAFGNAFISGYTSTNTGTSIASIGGHQTSFGGSSGFDAFIAKFDASGIRQWGTYYGGNGYEYGYSCATDLSGNVYLAGDASSSSGTTIATAGSHQSAYGGGFDAFLVKFNGSGVRQWGTYYGGTSGESGLSCATDIIGNVYLTGITLGSSGTTIATSNGYQNTYGGSPQDAFLVKFDACDVAPNQPTMISGASSVCGGVLSTYSTALAYGANTYTWASSSGNLSSGNSNTIALTPVSSGIFTLIAGNACGVSPQQTLNVTVNPLPAVGVNSGSICAGQTFTLLGSGADTYSYSGGAVVSPSITTSYIVTGTSSLGCTNTAVSTVTVNTPTISVNSGAICIGNNFVITPIGANTYTVTGGSFTVSPGVQTSYSVAGTSIQGCVSANTAVASVAVNPLPFITANSGVICAGSSFAIVPGGASSYTVTNGSFNVSPATQSTYSVTGTSAAGCVGSNTAVVTVSVNALPTVRVSTSDSLICVGESVVLTASGALTYTFNPGGVGAVLTVTPAINTTYNVTGTGASGCRNSGSILQSVDECTGVWDLPLTKGSSVIIYPNPTNGVVNVELDGAYEVEILNAMGQEVYSAKLCSGYNEIDLKNFASGIYIVKFVDFVNTKSIRIIKD